MSTPREIAIYISLNLGLAKKMQALQLRIDCLLYTSDAADE